MSHSNESTNKEFRWDGNLDCPLSGAGMNY